MISASVKTVGVDEATLAALSMFKPSTRRRAVRVGAKSANDAVKGWYRAKGRKHWAGTGPTQGPGRKASGWWRGTASQWVIDSANENGAVMSNSHIGLAHKITGGIIRAKRKSSLTIPVHPKAHGLTAAGFSATIAPLFRVKDVLAMKDKKGGITPVFALRKSVNQKPWPNAMPPETTYTIPFTNAAIDALEQSFQSGS
jgi:hypothetical protein